MAYIHFEKSKIVVLRKYEAAAFVNEYLRLRGEDDFISDECGDDILRFGREIGCVTPLNDNTFYYWHIEALGPNNHYDIDYLADHPTDELWFVDYSPYYKPALDLFNPAWCDVRIYTLYYSA